MSDLLNQRYQLLNELGEGGFSYVYRAHDTLLSRQVAIKILKVNAQKDPETTQRFFNEAKVTSQLNQENTLTIYDFGRDSEGRCFLVSELLEGQSLHRALSKGSLPVSEALSIVYQVGQALKSAHSRKIVHRDIKPANIFLTQSRQSASYVKLLDFGIAKALEEQGQTMTGQMMGTPSYMSPEQIVNIKAVDSRTDIYSLGVVLFHMLTGSVPFKHKSYYEVMRKHMQEPLPHIELKGVQSEVADYVQDLVRTMTVKDPKKRLQSIENVIQIVKSIWHYYPETQSISSQIDSSPAPLPKLSSSALPTSPKGKNKLNVEALNIGFKLETPEPDHQTSEQTQTWSKEQANEFSLADTEEQLNRDPLGQVEQSSDLQESNTPSMTTQGHLEPLDVQFVDEGTHQEDQNRSLDMDSKSNRSASLITTPINPDEPSDGNQAREKQTDQKQRSALLEEHIKEETDEEIDQETQDRHEYYSYLRRPKEKVHELDHEYLSQLYKSTKKEEEASDVIFTKSASSHSSTYVGSGSSTNQADLSNHAVESSNHTPPPTLSVYIGTSSTPPPELVSDLKAQSLSSGPPSISSSNYTSSSSSPSSLSSSSSYSSVLSSNSTLSSKLSNTSTTSESDQVKPSSKLSSNAVVNHETHFTISSPSSYQTYSSVYSNPSTPSATKEPLFVDHEAEVFKDTRPKYVPPKRPNKKKKDEELSTSMDKDDNNEEEAHKIREEVNLGQTSTSPPSSRSSFPQSITPIPSKPHLTRPSSSVNPSQSQTPSSKPVRSSIEASVHSQASLSQASLSQEKATSIRIVIIDPNDFVSNLYSNGLSKKFVQFQKKTPDAQKYKLHIAPYTDYKEALHLLKSSPIDLLMIEYKSNDYQIMEVLKALKAQGSLLYPIFILSNDRDKNEDEEKQLLNAGATLFLNKPLTLPTLFRHIVRHLPTLNSL